MDVVLHRESLDPVFERVISMWIRLYLCCCRRKMLSAYWVCVIRSVSIWSRWVEAADIISYLLQCGGRCKRGKTLTLFLSVLSELQDKHQASLALEGFISSNHVIPSSSSVKLLMFSLDMTVCWRCRFQRFSPFCLCQLLAVLLRCFPPAFRLAGCVFRNTSDRKIMSKQMLK